MLQETVTAAIKLPAEVRARSTVWIAIYAAKPFALIALALLPFVAAAQPLYWLPVTALAMLAAQRHFQTLVHDASHNFFHRNRQLNDRLSDWLAASWIGMDTARYRAVHMQHHAHNGSLEDPEHVSFETIRREGGVLRMILSYISMMESVRLVKKYFFAEKTSGMAAPVALSARLARLAPILGCQAVLALVCLAAGAWWVYGLWLYLAMTWNPLLSRLRFLAEHPGEGQETVTTLAPLLECAYFAPQSFNYHCEHHGWPGVPPYRLKQLHRYLREEVHYYDDRADQLSPSFVGKIVEQAREQPST